MYLYRKSTRDFVPAEVFKMKKILAWEYCLITVVVYCLVSFPDHVETQPVLLIQSSDIAIVGERFSLACLKVGFDQTQDYVVIRLNNEQLIQVFHGQIIYNARLGAFTMQSTDSGVVLTITEVNANDEGTYQCIVSNYEAWVTFSSKEIYVVVKEFPRPTCFGPSENSNSYVYTIINNASILTIEPSVTVSFVCSVNIDDSDVHVNPRWSRSDGKAIGQTQPFVSTAIVIFTSSLQDDGIHFICTSQNSTYANITKMCSIQVFVTPTFNIDLGPTVSLETSTSVVKTTKVEFGVIETSKIPADQTIHLTTSQTPMLTDSSSAFSVILAVGLGSSIGVILLTLPTIGIIILCIIKTCKKKQAKDTQDTAYYSSRINKEGAKEPPYYSSRFMDKSGKETPYYSSNITTSLHEMATGSSTNDNPHIYNEI